LKKKLTTFKKNSPLRGKRILITRPEGQAKDFIEALKAQGAEVVSFPTIRIAPPRDWITVDNAIENLTTYDALIFTSVNGVKFFFQRLKDKEKSIGSLKKLKIVAIGPKTAAAIKRRHLRVDIIPPKFQAESVVEALEKEGITGKRFLLPRKGTGRSSARDQKTGRAH